MFSVKICLGLCGTPDHLFDGLYEGVLFLSRMLLGKLELWFACWRQKGGTKLQIKKDVANTAFLVQS